MTNKIGIVTPYHKGVADHLTEACRSVDAQTVPVFHVLVGDGIRLPTPQGAADRINASLSRPIRDSGGTPRAIGAEIARKNGCDVIAYLDGDDALHPTFAEIVLKTFAVTGADIVSVPQALRGPRMESLDPQGREGHNMVHWVSEVMSGWQGPTAGKAFLSPAGLALSCRARQFDGLWTRVPHALARLHDIWFSWAIISAGLSIAWAPRPVYRYRMSDPSWFARSGAPNPKGLVPLDPEKAAAVRKATDTYRQLENTPKAFAWLCEQLSIDLARIPEAAELRAALRDAYPDFILTRSGDGRLDTIPTTTFRATRNRYSKRAVELDRAG